MQEIGPLYIISVAARLVEMHAQTLRKYERVGLVFPSRTEGNLRLYSDENIQRLLQIKYLVDELGINLAGVALWLQVTDKLLQLQKRLASSEDGAETRRLTERVLADVVETLGFSKKRARLFQRMRDSW